MGSRHLDNRKGDASPQGGQTLRGGTFEVLLRWLWASPGNAKC